jgi:hypothetical protein
MGHQAMGNLDSTCVTAPPRPPRFPANHARVHAPLQPRFLRKVRRAPTPVAHHPLCSGTSCVLKVKALNRVFI